LLLTTEQLAETLSVSDRSIQTWVKRRWIPYIKIGKRTIRFDPEDVKEALKEKFGTD